MMWDRFFEQRPIQNGLRRAGVHFAKAAYEVVGGIAAFVDEVASVVAGDNPGDGDGDETGPTKIVVE
jgi:hypothetical protein